MAPASGPSMSVSCRAEANEPRERGVKSETQVGMGAGQLLALAPAGPGFD